MSLWPLAIGVAGAAVTAGTFAVPAARRAVFGSVVHDWLGHELEFDRIDPDGITVRCKSGTVMRAYRLGGMAYDTKPEAEQNALHQGRTDFLHLCASRGVSIRVFGVKRRRDTAFPATWPSKALQEIGDAEAAQYRNGFEVRWFLAFATKDMRSLEDADEKLHSLLAGYKPQRLARAPAGGDCPLTGFLHFLVAGDLRDDLRAVSANVSANLPAANVTTGKDGTFLAHLPAPTNYRFICVKDWPELVSGSLLHTLMALPGEIEVSQVAVPIPREMDTIGLKRRANNPFAAEQVASECAAAVELLQQGKTSRLDTQMAVIVRGTSEAELAALTAEVTRILGDARVSYSIETKAAPVIWFNRLPDRNKLVRPLRLFAENVAALWPFESAPAGLAESQFGRGPVRSFRTGSGQTYQFQFQCSPAPKSLGNFLVIAPSNSGKSTLITHLLGGVAKFEDVRGYIFDSKEGCRWMVETMGGLYQSFDKLELNPLDIDDSPIARQRLALLVRLMLGEGTDKDGIEDVLSHLVETAFTIPRESRTFNSIYPLVFPPQSEMRQSFSRWVTDAKGREGLYARILNAPRDSLSGFLDKAHLVAVNMNEALEDPHLGPPVVAHIANAIEALARSGRARGTVVFIDEAANLLRNPAFRDWAAVMYREYRKFGGAVGMAFQDPGALFKSGIADAVIENSSCFFFYPNPQGNRDAYQTFNLNDEQKAFIFGAPEGRKVLVVKRDAATGFEESVILDIDLTPLGKPLRYYRSGPDAVRDLLSLQAKWGTQWPVHV